MHPQRGDGDESFDGAAREDARFSSLPASGGLASGKPVLPSDTVANLDIPFMASAIQSLIEPVRWLAAGDFQPQWKSGGQPVR
jgi:hypothetical protein